MLAFCCSRQKKKKITFDKGVRAKTVTLDGDAFEPQGTLTGGSTAQLGVVLPRLAELKSKSRELGAHEERLRLVDDKLERLSADSKKVRHTKNERFAALSAAIIKKLKTYKMRCRLYHRNGV